MNQYEAPVKDMMFVLDQLIGLDDLNKLKDCEGINNEFVESVLTSAAEIGSEVIAPTNVDGDRYGVSLKNGVVEVPPGYQEAYDEYIQGGWNGLGFKPEFGGQGLPAIIALPVNEIMMAANFSWSHLALLSQAAIRAMEIHANDELKNIYLRKMVSGKFSGTMVLTEPQAGSDLSALNTAAEPEQQHYKITGQKIFITWGDHELTDNIIHMVLARLPDAPEGVKGISLFLVPKHLVNADGSLGKRNRVETVSLEHKLGIHGCATCVMNYDAAEGYLVGQPNQGLACMFTMMNDARIGVGNESVAIAERSYQQALAYAKDRIQGSTHDGRKRVSIIHHPDVRRMLLTMKSQIEVMRAMVYSTAAELDYSRKSESTEDQRLHGDRADLMTPIVKGWCSEVCQELTSIGLQIHGGMGYIEETGAAQHFRDARITTIYEGTTSIQAHDLVGRKILKDRGLALKTLLQDIEFTMSELDTDHGIIGRIEHELSESIKSVKSSLNYLMDNYRDDHHLAGAISYNFLMMLGTLIAGWLAARSAQIAVYKIQSEASDREFYESKLVSCQFFTEQILPKVGAYARSISSGSVATMALSEDQF